MSTLCGWRLIGIAFLAASVSSGAHAETLVERFGKSIPDSAVRPFIEEALKNIHSARCEADNFCAAATEKEFENPPINLQDGRAALAHGVASALAQWCGLDWKRSFLPMMAFGRHKMKMGDRSLALMTLMHGSFQARQLKFYQSKGVCPDKLRADLDAQLPKL